MGNTTVSYIIVGGAILLIIFIYFKYYEMKNRKDFIKKVKREWGNIPTREYNYELLEGIGRYFENKSKEEFYIDDITWNDLDMDSIFMMLNNTNSSIGDQYLYYILRTPRFKKEELEERKRIIDFLENNEEARIKLQCMYGEIGRAGNYALSDYINNLTDLDNQSNLLQYGMLFLGISSILAALTIPIYGVLIFVGVLIMNVTQYYKRKGEIEPYFISISYISRLLRGADTFVKAMPSEFEEYAAKAKNSKDQFKKFRRNAKWVKSGKSATGSVEDVIFDYVKIFFHIDLIKFNDMLAEVKNKIEYIDILIETMGSIEAYMAIASFRGTREYYTIPELHNDQQASFNVEDIYHPMINNPVVNSIMDDRSVLITGSNASGKSTFLKTIAINAILAQTIYMTMSRKYSANFYRVFSSMALNDNLKNNESYYIVEIKSLKRILDASKDETPILCFIDEVLRGTNTVERIAASAQILNSLNKEQVMCFAATHDIELTQILEKIYRNYHFEEEVKDNDILFNYELRNGRATSRNAIKLLHIIGYDKQIIDQAEESAADFIETNSWRTLY
jgi:DNA mismatch repair ATPase MutS